MLIRTWLNAWPEIVLTDWHEEEKASLNKCLQINGFSEASFDIMIKPVPSDNR